MSNQKNKTFIILPIIFFAVAVVGYFLPNLIFQLSLRVGIPVVTVAIINSIVLIFTEIFEILFYVFTIIGIFKSKHIIHIILPAVHGTITLLMRTYELFTNVFSAMNVNNIGYIIRSIVLIVITISLLIPTIIIYAVRKKKPVNQNNQTIQNQ